MLWVLFDNAAAFEFEFNTGGYKVVLVFAEEAEISEALQDRVVAEVAIC